MMSSKLVILVAAAVCSSALLQGGDTSAPAPAADLVKTLEQTGPFTVFAPSNAAFNSLGFGGAKLTYLLNNKAQLTEVLEYHVTAGKRISNTLKDGEQINMLAGGSTTV